MAPTPQFYKKGIGYFGALIVGALLTVATLAVTGNLTVGGNATITGNLAVTGTSAFTGAVSGGSASFSGTATSTKEVVGATGSVKTLEKSAVASLDFPVILAGQCVARTMTVTGATTSTTAVNEVSVGVQPSIVSSATATSWFGYVSAADTVSVVGCNGSLLAQPELPATNFSAAVKQFTP